MRLARTAGLLDLALHGGQLFGLASGDDDVRAEARDLAVDGDPTVGDQLLADATRSEARARHLDRRLAGDRRGSAVGAHRTDGEGQDRDNAAHYAPQLEAYAYSLENPAVGDRQRVDSMGLLVWNPDHAEVDGFKIRQKYVPVPRDTVRFNALVEDLITMLEGDLPSSGVDCPTCKFLKARNALD